MSRAQRPLAPIREGKRPSQEAINKPPVKPEPKPEPKEKPAKKDAKK